ncbi:ribosomal protein L7/L12 [Calothrix sp. CCY 0018]|uniref:ribosomal protein L7/L12 n=1 Tax=Calothrix sp. CCY 0018 TaxID=3103864 RepID=UPI0039C6BE11
MSVQILEMIEQLKSLNLTETSELVKKIDDIFNMNACRTQVNLTVVINPIADDGEAESQQTEFDAILEKLPFDKKVAILELLRGITGLGLKAKDVDSVPQAVSGITIAEAEEIKQQLEAVEAKVFLK